MSNIQMSSVGARKKNIHTQTKAIENMYKQECQLNET